MNSVRVCLILLEGCTKRKRQGTPFFVNEMFMRRLLLSGFSGSPTLERVIDSSDAQRYVKVLIRWLGSSENCSQSWRLKQLLGYVVIGTSLIRKFFPRSHIPVDLAVEIFFSGNCNLSTHGLTLKGCTLTGTSHWTRPFLPFQDYYYF